MPSSPVPPPTPAEGGGVAVTVDVTEVTASLRFDPATRSATQRSAVRFTAGGDGGRPALDLRQYVESIHLDGHDLGAEAWPVTDLGGGPGAGMRVLEAVVEPASTHLLELEGPLDTPHAEGAVPIGWRNRGVRFDLWMSDLRPGRYLESWLPAPLPHDRFALTVRLEIAGTDRPHVVLTNGAVRQEGEGMWRVEFPPTFTSLSPMLVVAPVDEVEQRSTTVEVAGRPAPLRVRTSKMAEVDADLAACEEDVVGWVTHNAARYGPWAHGDAMTVVVWGPGRGMEYDGATTASVGALEHEVFHSWFGRGVKPAHASDGWIDEAFTSWATSTRRSEGPRFAAEELGLDDEPVVLCPPSPWSRHTPIESYTVGSRLFAGVAARIGGADRLRSAMAAYYRANAGGFVDTDGLAEHLRVWSGVGVGDLWSRYVHGRA
ncbi:MAG TPA: hypothetical protein VFP61_14550 [Acidimicrobiales bacterium]|nr:hypothetical protein [Acidimicrobiales bacterium]